MQTLQQGQDLRGLLQKLCQLGMVCAVAETIFCSLLSDPAMNPWLEEVIPSLELLCSEVFLLTVSQPVVSFWREHLIAAGLWLRQLSLTSSLFFFLPYCTSIYPGKVIFLFACVYGCKCQIGSEEQLNPAVGGSRPHGLFLGKMKLGIALLWSSW